MHRAEPNERIHAAIDVLIVDPSASDAKKTSQALRRATSSISIVRVLHADQALRLMFDRGLFTATPQLPRLILLDIAFANDTSLLQRLRTEEQTRNIPLVILSAQREALASDDALLLEAAARIVKHADSAAYDAAIAGILSTHILSTRPKSAADRSRGARGERCRSAVRVQRRAATISVTRMHPIDVLLIEPSRDDAQRTLTAIRRKAPHLSTVHLASAEDALDLIFDYWPGDAPHVPRLVIMDLAASGDAGKTVLRRLTEETLTQHVPTVAFSANRNAGDMLETFLLGAKMNILKPSDPAEYGVQIERVVAKWFVN